jgi:transposase
MIRVTETSLSNYRAKLPLVLALANKTLNEIGLVELIDNMTPWDMSRQRLSNGQLAKVVVLSTFFDIRVVLTHIEERFEQIDLGYLLGASIEDTAVNSFNLGRALGRIGEGDCGALYQTMALTAIQQNDIPVKRLHGDTTTISFYGEYDISRMNLSEEEKEEVLKIERGYNKDGRPWCKQVVVGQITTEQGIPVVSKTLDGGTSDMEWNRQALDYIEEIKGKGFTDVIFVADSKLVYDELVRRMNSPGSQVRFVSRCPASFSNKLSGRMKERAYSLDAFAELGSVGKSKLAAAYRGVSYIEDVCGSPMRLLVLESSALEGNAEKAIEKEKEQLLDLARKTEKKTFMCQADAELECERLSELKVTRLFDVSHEIIKSVKEKWPRGRRSKDTKPIITETWTIRVTNLSRNEDACLRFKRDESSFVLISNVTEGVSDYELLEIYKGQHIVENSFRQLKSPQLASVIFLENPIRIKAMTMLLSVALLVRAIVQHRLRDGLRKYKEKNPTSEIMAGWGGRPLNNPTFKLFYEHSSRCYYQRERQGDYSFAWPNYETKAVVMPLLELLGLNVTTLIQ